ncbi:MAG: hypothetical protein AAF578_07125 [Pseudomonadota bacterium]
MRALRRIATVVAIAFGAFGASALQATTVAQMNLEQMVNNSDRVFVGTVLDVTESRKQIGGGELPAVTYRIKVSESFKGDFSEIKGEFYTEVTTLGTLKNIAEGHHPITDFPMLQVGEEYLLMVAPVGPIGLTATMGLGQGCFTITGDESDKVALNGAGNVGLFAGMQVGVADGGPISWGTLSSMITDIVGGAE